MEKITPIEKIIEVKAIDLYEGLLKLVNEDLDEDEKEDLKSDLESQLLETIGLIQQLG